MIDIKRLAAVAGLVVAALVLAGCGESKTPEQRAQETCEDEHDAFWMSQDFVKRALKAPTTAKFPATMRNDGIRSKYLGECVHEIWAYVDSQNSFGAMIRTHYYAKVKNQKGTDTWSLLDIRM